MRICFWEYLWWRDQPLCSLFTYIYIYIYIYKPLYSQFPRLSKVVIVKTFPSQLSLTTLSFSWNLNFRRNLIDLEIEDLERLMPSINCVHLSSVVSDVTAWLLSSSGLFLVNPSSWSCPICQIEVLFSNQICMEV